MHGELRRDAAEIPGAQVGAECREAGTCDDDTDHHAERSAQRADEAAREQRCSELLAHGHAHCVQQRDLAAAPRDGQRLGRVDEETAGEERHQREGGEIRAIGTRQAHCVVARLAWCREPHARGQQGADGGLDRGRIGPGGEPKIHAIESAEAVEAPLRGRDVEHAERLAILARWQ